MKESSSLHGTRATDLHNCDFAAYAENCGDVGIRVTEPQGLEKAVEQALAEGKPTMVDIEMDPKRFE